MDALIIEETKGTPYVRFYPYGKLYFEGRSLPEDPSKFYTPILEWIQNCEAENITLEMRIQYMNTSSTKEMYTFFKKITENKCIKNANVIWYYEEGDDDNYNTGREFESMTKIPFHFHEFAEAME
jgi:hypothetical protein